jgi:hypothetical protein
MNLPFQAEDGGSQTAILMSESLEGLSVASTRQNMGRSLYGTTVVSPGGKLPEEDAGGANAPAGTDCAKVIVMPRDASDARLSQDSPAISGIPKTAATITAQKLVDTFISLPFISRWEKRHSVTGSGLLANQIPLEFGDAGENRRDHLARNVLCCWPRPGKGLEFAAGLIDCVHRVNR